MPTIRLTQLAVEKLAAPSSGRVIYWDRLLPGFGLRLTANGARSWVAMFRVDGKAVMQTIGPVAKLPRIDDARHIARESLAQAAAGKNPVAEKRIATMRNLGNGVDAVVVRYLEHCDRSLRPKTAREWRRIFCHDVLPRWGNRPLAEITKADVLELVGEKAARRERKRKRSTEGAAVQAGKTLTRLRTFFRWAVDHDLVAADPTVGVRRPAKEASRDRLLSDDEIRCFWAASGTLGHPFGALFQLLLLSAQRVSEVAGIRWSEISDAGVWEIPGTRAKNGKPHFVHLSRLAREIISGVPRIAGQDLLFSGTGRTAVSGISGAKARLDARIAAAASAGIPPWTLHDLRRTATTGLARLGVAPHVADRILNHQAGVIRGVAAVYNRFEYLPERQAALEIWGRHVESLIRPISSSNVVPIAVLR